ncbi:MAG: hypothetical protein FWC70_10780 [Defluviitaleaceae bacterium]|nr:hypothetical protein [Defluviitaleaceae bacterium]
MDYAVATNDYDSPEQKSVGNEMVSTRQAQEVQAAMIVARKFPRDENAAFARIIKACERKNLAEQAMYEYARGGAKVTGPSIRLMETAAQCWGNIDTGIVELEQKNGESTMMAYAWDLEANTRVTKVFVVKHWRDTKTGGYKLKESRDIYEMTANMGARRLRACIMGIIPGDVVDAAVKQCEKTIVGDSKTPLIDTVRGMILTFESDHQVTQVMLEKFIGCKSDAFTRKDVLRLAKVYKSLADGMASREQYFEIPGSDKKPEKTKVPPPPAPAAKESPEEPSAPEPKQDPAPTPDPAPPADAPPTDEDDDDF